MNDYKDIRMYDKDGQMMWHRHFEDSNEAYKEFNRMKNISQREYNGVADKSGRFVKTSSHSIELGKY